MDSDEFTIATFTSVGTTGSSGIKLTTSNINLLGATIEGGLIPFSDDAWDLGSASTAWAGLYLGPDEIIHFNNVAVFYQQPTTKHTVITAPTTSKVFIQYASSGRSAILDASSIASTDKTFTFPNTTGTFALTSDITAAISDTAYDATSWNGVTTIAPSKNAVRDAIENILDGITFTGDIVVPDEAYGSGWDGSFEVPTKNAVYDKIETISGGGMTVGAAISGGTNNTVLYKDNSGNLGSDADLTWDGATLAVTGTQFIMFDVTTLLEFSVDSVGLASIGTGGSQPGFQMIAGTAAAVTAGGDFVIRAGRGGTSSMTGGNATIQGGSGGTANGPGGHVVLLPGSGTGIGSDGGVFIAQDATDTFRGKLNMANISADRTFTFPDQDGTIALVGGSGISRTVVTTSGSLTLGAAASTDYTYFVAGAHTLTMPTAVANTNRYSLKNNHSAAITVDTTSAQTIDGGSTLILQPNDAVDLMSNNSNWFVF